MNKENTYRLFADFPVLYQQHKLDKSKTAMCYGFECGDGWFDLLYKLSQNLEQFPEVQVNQVKEKFGSLRFYVQYDLYDEASNSMVIEEMISEAEGESMRTCDTCGKPAVSSSRGGWIRTVCEECKP